MDDFESINGLSPGISKDLIEKMSFS